VNICICKFVLWAPGANPDGYQGITIVYMDVGTSQNFIYFVVFGTGCDETSSVSDFFLCS
ncbi:hypothetical protein ACQP3J_27250, partial [Escherichia coli]